MSCDPAKALNGIKGLDSGREYCMPYWKEWSKNEAGLREEISKLLSRPSMQTPSLELISIISDTPDWKELELTVLIHLCYTRVPADENNPILKFFCLWFEKPVDETVTLLSYFNQLFLNQFRQDSSPFNKVAEDFYTKYSLHKNEYSFAGKLYWEDALEKSVELSSQIDSTNIIPVVDTIVVENPIAKLVEELTIAGASRMSIVMEAMRSFPERNLSLAQWADEVASYIDNLSSPETLDDTPASSLDVIGEPPSQVSSKQSSHRRIKPRLKMRSITVDGFVIQESNPTQMFVEFIEHVGADLVYEMQIPFRGAFLVDKRPIPGFEAVSKLVGNGYYLCTNSNTNSKIELMQEIADFFSLNLEIDRYYKEKED